ncbi:MAG: ABC transporter permease [Gammaproteobacteria bacterium]|nr:MAG: ABC transporter permease [Gammaproteobacteria bacterium]UTW42308.1 ABC transporter permease [bacterium SCSIO 12844]
MVEFIFLYTDLLLWLLVIIFVGLIFVFRKTPYLAQIFYHVKSSKLGVVCGLILALYLIIALSDSVHFKRIIVTDSAQVSTKPYSETLLDLYLSPWHDLSETTYSMPFSKASFVKSSEVDKHAKLHRAYAPLQHLKPLPYTNLSRLNNIILLSLHGFLKALVFVGVLFILWVLYCRFRLETSYRDVLARLVRRKFDSAWLSFWFTLLILLSLIFIVYHLLPYFHLLGTDKVGNDVLYQAVKSIRTAVIIGTLTTLILLPLAVIFGVLSGYFGGIVDDIIQYIYTTLNSIPGILLIASFSLLLTVIMSKYSEHFASSLQRSDLRLLGLCIILGITSWSSLCRLLRAETLKVKQLDYIMAAKSLGSSNFTILRKHILPNIVYLILISIVIDFSSLVLAESILSYVGIGVDPTMASWGNMINSARLELAREPIIWWPLLAAFVFMFILVLAANLFADVIRDALDPKLN